MKLVLAQTHPIKGDIDANIVRHLKLIQEAIRQKADVILFSELSITGYEPQLAEKFVMSSIDPRFDEFQLVSDSENITIGIGAPIKSPNGICISLVVFQPAQERRIYSKQHLHPDEESYFTRGQGWDGILNKHLAFAICYEISIPEHAERAFQSGAKIYMASVAKTADGMNDAMANLPKMARKNAMVVGVTNCIGHFDGVDCGGKSSFWNQQGELIAQMDEMNEGLLLCTVQSDFIKAEIIPLG